MLIISHRLIRQISSTSIFILGSPYSYLGCMLYKYTESWQLNGIGLIIINNRIYTPSVICRASEALSSQAD